jgi:cysteine desulfuration protein SufE
MSNGIDEIQDDIIQDFSKFKDWFEIYENLIKMGKNFESADQNILNDDNLISGCQSQVWLKADITKEKIHYSAYSDSLIVKGMISLLLKVLNEKNPQDIVNADLYFIEKIGLKSNLSPSRANGLRAIIKNLKSYAEKAIKN